MRKPQSITLENIMFAGPIAAIVTIACMSIAFGWALKIPFKKNLVIFLTVVLITVVMSSFTILVVLPQVDKIV